MTVCAPPFLKTPQGYETVRHWFDDDARRRGDDWSGWYIVFVDGEGEPFDAIGPYDSEGFARRMIADENYRP